MFGKANAIIELLRPINFRSTENKISPNNAPKGYTPPSQAISSIVNGPLFNGVSLEVKAGSADESQPTPKPWE